MASCLKCGKKTESDFLLWKGGASQALCEECKEEEYKKRKSKEEPDKNSIYKKQGDIG